MTGQVIAVSKLVKLMLTSLVIIMLGGIITYVVLTNAKADPIEDLVKYSYETPEITTDLQDGGFVRIQFQIVTDGKKAKNEIASRDFQLDRKSTRLNSSHVATSYAVFCLKKKLRDQR